VKYYYNLKSQIQILFYFKCNLSKDEFSLFIFFIYSSLQCHMVVQKLFWFDDLALKKHFFYYYYYYHQCWK